MTVSWRSWTDLLFICLSLCAAGVVSQTFQLEPPNATVLQGSNVSFNATVQGDWRVMSWRENSLQVLSITDKIILSDSPERYSARFCSSDMMSCVEFTIHNVELSQAGVVTCTVQGEYGSKEAPLSIQESGTVSILEQNVTAVQDEQVEFHCVATAWFPTPTISWKLNDNTVNSSLYNTTSTAAGDYFNSSSVLIFQAVKDTTVVCLATVEALQDPLTSSEFLVVVPKPTDWTVLIAVVVSFSGFALLVLLIIGIIYCYKHRKEKQTNYQDEMNRRVRTQSEISVVARQGQGQVNAGYTPEGQTSVAPSELTDSGFSQANGSNIFEMPDVVNQAENSYKTAYDTVDDLGFRKHRHVTIV